MTRGGMFILSTAGAMDWLCALPLQLVILPARQFFRRERSEGSESMYYYVYILTNQSNTVLYTGVTNDLIRRTYEHKQNLIDGFTKRYRLHKLIHYEQFNDVMNAIGREKQIKGWIRAKKNSLINLNNSKWIDLYPGLL